MVVGWKGYNRFGKRKTWNKRKSKSGLAVRATFMPKSLGFKRYNQIDTKTFWFKQNGQLATPAGNTNIYFAFRTKLLANPPVPYGLLTLFELYDQFKIAAYRIRWFPNAIGTESGQVLASGVWNRGNHIVWSDQRWDPLAQDPDLIEQVLNHGSARMIDPRRNYTRILYRPRGEDQWGSCNDPIGDPDPWDASINMLVNDATISRVLWYYTLTYKIIVRGRRQDA